MVRDLGVSARHKNPFMKRITPFEFVFLRAPGYPELCTDA
jgi:hypothetical protein